MNTFVSRERYQRPMLPDVGYKVAFIGTSLIQQNDVATASKISHWGRGWVSWARVLSRSIFFSPIWFDATVYPGWEPSGTPGATRFFRGLNAGVSGQTTDQINVRKSYLINDVDCDIVVIDAGTNDVNTSMSKEDIQSIREEMADYFLNRGKVVILLPILARAVSSWTAGSAARKKANWINQKSRDYVRSRSNCYLFDWNERWVDPANSNGEPRSGYSADGIHFAPLGAFQVGRAFAQFLATILPPAQPRVISPDDLYDATDNPLGNLLTNPFCTGTGGAVTNATGSVATGMRVERTSGTSTVVASKESRTDGRGDYQVITITPAGTGENLIYFRTNSADLAHTLPFNTWVQASVEVDVAAYAGYRGISLFLEDRNTGGLDSYALEPFDPGSGNALFPSEAWTGTLVTPPIKTTGPGNFRWRLEIRIDGAIAGSPVVKAGAVELRPVADPAFLLTTR